jgi:hypothetical protein
MYGGRVHMKGRGVSGGKGTKEGAKKNNYLAYLKRHKGMSKADRPAYNPSEDYASEKKKVEKKMKKEKRALKEGDKRRGKPLNPSLQKFNKCIQRARKEHPDVAYRVLQKAVAMAYDKKTGECNKEELVAYVQSMM